MRRPCVLLIAYSMGASSGCLEPGPSAGGIATDRDDEGTEDGDATEGITESLVDVEAWELDPEAPPSLAADRPETMNCENGFRIEDGLFEIDTELCNWGAFSQRTLAPIWAGDTVEILMLHDQLYSEDDDAVAHLAVAIADTTVWEATVAIPAPAGYLRPTVTIEQDVEVGTRLHLHVHNHGANNYRVVGIVVSH